MVLFAQKLKSFSNSNILLRLSGKIFNGKCEEKNCLRNQLDLSLFRFIAGTTSLVLERTETDSLCSECWMPPVYCYIPNRFWRDVGPSGMIAIFIVLFYYHGWNHMSKGKWKWENRNGGWMILFNFLAHYRAPCCPPVRAHNACLFAY